jgi:uncharacterized protein YceH (UPF0502 family)
MEPTNPPALPVLDVVQARVLGSLVEKAATTPETYPLTLNAAVLACNQKSNRDPLMELEPGAVGHALRQLEDLGLVKVQHASRALRYEHRLDEALVLTSRQRALLGLLLLRGPQTLNELHVRSERLAKFEGADTVRETLERMASREPALAVQLPRSSGQREERWMHLLAGPVDVAALAAAMPVRESTIGSPGLESRVAALEAEVAALRAGLDALTNR